MTGDIVTFFKLKQCIVSRSCCGMDNSKKDENNLMKLYDRMKMTGNYMMGYHGMLYNIILCSCHVVTCLIGWKMEFNMELSMFDIMQK